ncbi:MAG: hypothetical protein GY868_18350 [Deltaproteobacteria bacterium]|nr:hypothetical protein [Deltaproteobacteria bacterium]
MHKITQNIVAKMPDSYSVFIILLLSSLVAIKAVLTMSGILPAFELFQLY